MKPERWTDIEPLYRAALEQEPSRRKSFLDAVCGSDQDLHREVWSLLTQSASPPASTDTGKDTFEDDLVTRTMVGPGAKFGPYQIVSPLGEGGMGKVFRALDTRLGRAVAIKVSNEKFNQRFEREARAISALNHPNICTLYDVGASPSGAWYMVTELVDGETLRAWLSHSPSLERGLGVVRQLIDALRAAHEAGIVHRDLKPANIMVRFDGYVKVLDFGLAKRIPGAGKFGNENTGLGVVSIPGQVVGTAAYMSPEQILGQEADARSDLFALGIILYEMAAGRHPWAPRKSMVDTMHAILNEEPPPVDGAPAGLERILRRCLAKQPESRFQTMAELGAALQRLDIEPASNPAVKPTSIAVLPFTNMSAEKENEYFGDGLAEEIINILANVTGINVAGRTSSFFFKGKDIEFGEVGKRLNVDHILEGSVRRAGNRIRVTAQIIKLSDGFHLWSERYDRELTDIFAIQDEIAEAIAGVLRVKLSPDAGAPRRYMPNLRAYEAYLKARDLWFNAARPEALAPFKELLDRAIDLDPKFALAHSFLGLYYTMQANLGIRKAQEVIPLALASEQSALRIDPSLPEAHALLAVCLGGYEYDWNKAERHWRLALAPEPVSRDVLFWYGNHFLLPTGRIREALDAMARGLEGDPLNLFYRQLFARGLRFAGRLEEAEIELRKILEIDENYATALSTLGSVCAQQGRFEEGLALTQKAHELMPWSNLVSGQLAALLVRMGDANRADVLIEQLKPGTAPGASAGLTLFYAMCGDFDRASDYATVAVEQRDMPLVHNVGPFLRSGPRWPALAKMMNLPTA